MELKLIASYRDFTREETVHGLHDLILWCIVLHSIIFIKLTLSENRESVHIVQI